MLQENNVCNTSQSLMKSFFTSSLTVLKYMHALKEKKEGLVREYILKDPQISTEVSRLPTPVSEVSTLVLKKKKKVLEGSPIYLTC